jgi:hypothetical protein
MLNPTETCSAHEWIPQYPPTPSDEHGLSPPCRAAVRVMHFSIRCADAGCDPAAWAVAAAAGLPDGPFEARAMTPASNCRLLQDKSKRTPAGADDGILGRYPKNRGQVCSTDEVRAKSVGAEGRREDAQKMPSSPRTPNAVVIGGTRCESATHIHPPPTANRSKTAAAIQRSAEPPRIRNCGRIPSQFQESGKADPQNPRPPSHRPARL